MKKKYTSSVLPFPSALPLVKARDVVSGRILIISPTYNEAENISILVERIMSLGYSNIDVLVIDDNSPDGTSSVVKNIMAKTERVFLIEHPLRSGLGIAYLAGFRFAIQNNYDYVFEMDADLSHQPEMIPYFLDSIQNADLVIGSRYLDNMANVVNWPISRLILSKSASLYTRIITGMPIKDPTSGFKCFRISALRQLNLDSIRSTGYSFQIEVTFKLWKKGLRLLEIPIIFFDRVSGSSKMNRQIIFEAIMSVWIIKLKSLFGEN